MKKNKALKYLWDENNPLGYKNRMGLYKTKRELEFIKSCLPNHKLEILDIGGGSGRFALPLSQLNHDVTIIDISNDAIELAKQKGLMKSYCINLIDFNGKKYDVALAIELFLVTEPNEVFKNSNRLIKKGGILIFVCTNNQSWRYKLRNLRKNKTKNYDNYNLIQYKELLYNNEFEVDKIEGFNWMPFSVNSNNILIPFFEKLEKLFMFKKWLQQSPWFLIACKKIQQ